MKIDTNSFAEDKDKSSYIRKSGSSNQSCNNCGGNHNVPIIGLEKGGHIITEHFFKECHVKINVNFNVNRKATFLDLINSVWPKQEPQRRTV